MPTDRRLQRLAQACLARPSERRSLTQWGREFGISDRHLARRFRLETGLSFGEWLRAMRASLALQHLSAGRRVADIADQLGYTHASAFISMFRKALGESPARFGMRAGQCCATDTVDQA
ncbi:helix-turn-helix transcriptional regulator [Pandoraea sp. NPDC090278]|uniref:helix-turn-helix transcriptional regulator n=1 Tax=Pandoraea sp. NPDC090278 TaxID=3364391 RepID=UPI00383B7B2F